MNPASATGFGLGDSAGDLDQSEPIFLRAECFKTHSTPKKMGAAKSRVVRVPNHAKRGREQPAAGESTEQSDVRRQLADAQQTAAAAEGIMGPYEAYAAHVVARWPSGAPIELGVLSLGEAHMPYREEPRAITVRQLMQVAAVRARQRGTCVDAYIEASMTRAAWRDGRRVRRDRSMPRQVTSWGCSLAQVAWSMAGAVAAPHDVPAQQTINPLGATGARVHWFDARPELIAGYADASDESGLINVIYYGENVRLDRRVAEEWMATLMGLTDTFCFPDQIPPPPDLVELLLRLVGREATDAWLRAQAVTIERVSRRARRIPLGDLQWLATHVIETQPHNTLRGVLANVADFYLMLRMLLRFPAGNCPAGPPRHCLVYAGSSHTRHAQAILRRIGSDWEASVVTWTGGRAHDTWLEVPIEQLLTAMGLGRSQEGDVVQTTEV